MAATTLLRIIDPGDTTPVLPVPIPLIPARAGYEHLTSRERATTPAVATREALLQRLAIVGDLSPDAPLSFLVIHVHGMGLLEDPEDASRALEAITHFVVGEIGPLDLAGRFSASSFGVILQGKGTRATSALAAKLQFTLNRLDEVRHPIRVDVYAATGTGSNASVLPAAAGNSLPEIG
jgi:hypothetical protein